MHVVCTMSEENAEIVIKCNNIVSLHHGDHFVWVQVCDREGDFVSGIVIHDDDTFNATTIMGTTIGFHVSEVNAVLKDLGQWYNEFVFKQKISHLTQVLDGMAL